MVARILIIASVACVFNLANGIPDLFPGFKPCKSSDNACLLENTKYGIKPFVAGLSAMGIQSSDPIHYDRVDASTKNLKFVLSNVTLSGLGNCEAIDVKRDEPNLTMVLVLQCDLKLEGDYEMKGKLLIAEIDGADKILAELRKMISTITCKYMYKEGKDGKKRLRIKNFVHTYELKEKANLVFKGLFPHNEVLRAAMIQFVKDSPNEIIKEVGKEMMDVVVKSEVENMNKLFTIVPYEDLALD